MSRKRVLDVVSWIMAEEGRGRNSRRREVTPPPPRSRQDSTATNDEEQNRMNFNGRTFYDFESDNSLPNLTVKTFLRDCITHPKILFHKDYQFFRRYLIDIGMDLSLPQDSPFSEDHQDDTFCVDKGDKKWLAKLKSRVEREDVDNYWASIIPVKRRSDLGLVIFRWQSALISTHFLHVYLKFCESKSEPNSSEYVDAYVEDFMKAFDIERNMDTETRLIEDIEAREMRRSRLGIVKKEEPAMTREASVLLILPKQNPNRIPSPVRSTRSFAASSSFSSAESKGESSRKASSSISSQQTCNESDTSSVTSGDESDCSEYLGPHSEKRRRRKGRKTKASSSFSGESSGLDTSIQKSSFNGNNNSVDNPASSLSNGIGISDMITRRCNGFIRKPNGKFPGQEKSEMKPVEFTCKICTNNKIFSTNELLNDHVSRVHVPTLRNLIRCNCGINIAKEFIDFHKRSCRRMSVSSNSRAQNKDR